MPISTPEKLVNLYGGDPEHFVHVLDHLFTPAIRKIEYEPIPPIAEGADLIHAEIIKQLEMADLVLCDMSAHNANVFFELGIRTALDKPICLVKDIATTSTPFDTGIINFHSYDHSLSPWALSNQIESLSQHLLKSVNNSENRNPLWKYFGLSSRAKFSEGESGLEAKIDLLTLQIEAIQRQTKEKNITGAKTAAKGSSASSENEIRKIVSDAQEIADMVGAKLESWETIDNKLVLDFGTYALEKHRVERIVKLGKHAGIEIEVKIAEIVN